MKIRKFVFMLLLLAYVYFMYDPIVIVNPVKQTGIEKGVDLNVGDKIEIFEPFDFDNGKWKACLIINERVEISSKVPYGRYLFTDDLEVLRMLEDMKFNVTSGDLATVENEILLFRNDTLVYKSFIVLDSKIQGLQNCTVGWVVCEPDKLNIFANKFKSNFLPIIYL